MKKLLLPLLLLLVLPGTAHAQLPSELLGIVLGKPVETYHAMLDMATDARDRDALYVNEVDLRNELFPGVRGGSISYGNCANPGTVVGVKLKLDDPAQSTFNALYARYEKAFGKPDEYQGDAFKTIIAWKWRFRKDNEEVQVVLTWSKDPEMRPGTSIKLRHRTLWEAEYLCQQQQRSRTGGSDAGTALPAGQLDRFLPKAP
ncbi:MAG: hypothetical protein LDL30_00695 [Desulfovibrio sp.]|nr:hypothetical protein [Desulfovibrio sp.]MCA1986374.1 hypothetical protein [Desulfovibrio sp.]